MSASVSLPQQWLMTSWNKQTSYNSGAETRRNEIVREATNYEKLYTGLYLNCRDFFYLEDFFGGIGIVLLKFRLLRSPDIFWNRASWISRSTSALDSLVVEISESRPFSSVFVGRSLAVACPSAPLAGLLSSSSFNHSSWLQCDRGSLRAKDLGRRWTCGFQEIFASSTSSKTKMDKKVSCVFVLMLAMKEPDREQFVRNITPQHDSLYMWQLAVNFI